MRHSAGAAAKHPSGHQNSYIFKGTGGSVILQVGIAQCYLMSYYIMQILKAYI